MTANEKSVPSTALMMRHTMSIAATARLKKAIPDHTISGAKPTVIMTKEQKNGSGTKTIAIQSRNLTDDWRMSMERKEVITTLEDLKSRCPKYTKEYQALDYAISSVKTDEAYQLEYEDRDCVEVIRCKDCKYFEYDTFAKVDGVPLIVGHEMCNKWADGCKTSENGYCFLAEAKN